MLRADTVMDAAQLGLEIGEHEVNDRREGLGNLQVAPLRDGGVGIAALAQLGVTTPVVSDDDHPGSDIALDEVTERTGASVRNQGESNTTGVSPGLPLVEAAGTLALPNLDSAGDDDHIVDATPLTAGTPAHVCFISLDDFSRFATDSVLVGANHSRPQLMEYLEGGFVARQAELPMELDGRHAGCLAGNQVRSSEPAESGVCVRSITVPAVRRVSRRHLRQQRTPRRVA